MPAGRDDALAAIAAARDTLDDVVAAAADKDWSKETYEGWTARDLLCHVAASSNVAGFLLAMARNPGATFGAGDDNDAFNARQVAIREGRTIDQLAAEARGYLEADVERVTAAPPELLSSRYLAPWGDEGVLADLIVDALRDHLMLHIRDLAAAVAPGVRVP